MISETVLDPPKNAADLLELIGRLGGINPRRKTVTVYTSLTSKCVLTESETLDGGDVLPGFALPLGEFFSNLSRRA